MTVLDLRKIPFYISCPYWHCCLYSYVYIILTPYEYYMVLPALAINAASKPRLAASALHTALWSNSIIYISVQYTLLRCAIMTVLSLRKIPFIYFRPVSCWRCWYCCLYTWFHCAAQCSFRLAPLILWIALAIIITFLYSTCISPFFGSSIPIFCPF